MTEVLLITIDSFRHDYCSEEHLPRSWPFLEHEFNRFTRAYSHGVATPFAFPGVVAGVPPAGDGTLPPSATLAELAEGRTVCFANNPHLRPERGYDRGFDEFSYLGGRSGSGLKDKTVNWLGNIDVLKWGYDAIQNVLETVSDDGFTEPYRPAVEQVSRVESALDDGVAFCWGHFQDPHYPFSLESVPDRNLTDTFDPERIRRLNDQYTTAEFGEDPEAVSGLLAVYGENIRYLDRHLSTLLERLHEESWFEDKVVVITADHGEVFGEHGLTNHPWDAPPVEELVKVPLFVSTPNSGGEPYDHLVQHSDLYESLAEFLDGDAQNAEHRYGLYDESRRRVISKSNSVIRCTTPNGSITRQRNGETETDGNVTESDREYAEKATFPSIGKSADPGSTGTDSDQQEIESRLKALGYFE